MEGDVEDDNPLKRHEYICSEVAIFTSFFLVFLCEWMFSSNMHRLRCFTRTWGGGGGGGAGTFDASPFPHVCSRLFFNEELWHFIFMWTIRFDLRRSIPFWRFNVGWMYSITVGRTWTVQFCKPNVDSAVL